jgi:hypothetical protein
MYSTSFKDKAFFISLLFTKYMDEIARFIGGHQSKNFGKNLQEAIELFRNKGTSEVEFDCDTLFLVNEIIPKKEFPNAIESLKLAINTKAKMKSRIKESRKLIELFSSIVSMALSRQDQADYPPPVNTAGSTEPVSV